jgi:hypothetical protein
MTDKDAVFQIIELLQELEGAAERMAANVPMERKTLYYARADAMADAAEAIRRKFDGAI